MQNTRNMILAVLSLLLCSSLAWGQVGLEKVGQSTMNFQLVSISPAASAMGDAYCAIGQGAESIFFNPAGISETTNKLELRLFSTQWIADINYMGGAAVWKTDHYGSMGFSLVNVDYGTLRGTSLLSAGETALYPLGYRETGDFTAGASSFGLSYGKAISNQFLAGGNIRMVSQNLGRSLVATGEKENSISHTIFDAGVKYYAYSRNFWFGMSIRNFSSSIKREFLSDQSPVQFTMGMAAKLFDLLQPNVMHTNQLRCSLDFQHSNNYSERIALGLEYQFGHVLALRGGYYSNHDLASWSLGLGANTSFQDHPLHFDYSYSNMDIFQGVNRFSIGYSF